MLVHRLYYFYVIQGHSVKGIAKALVIRRSKSRKRRERRIIFTGMLK